MSNYEYANGTGLSVLSQQIFEHLTPLVESVKVFFLASYDRENPPKIGKYIENEDGNSIWATEDNAIFAMEPWSDTPPERLPGMYLWTYTEAIFKDGSIYNSDPVCLVTWDDIDNAVNGMTASLETGLALKADKATTYTKTEVDNFVDTGTVTSEAENPLVIETDAAQTAKSTIINIEPIQDLHGYDHPWPAGSTNNLLAATPYGGAYAQAVGTDLKTVHGTAMNYHFSDDAQTVFVDVTTAWDGRLFATGQLQAGTYVSFNWEITEKDRITIYITDSNLVVTEVVANQSSHGGQIARQITVTEGQRIAVVVSRTAVGTASVKHLQVHPDGVTTYTPFENICPITGVDEVEVRATGKNLASLNCSWYTSAYGTAETNQYYISSIIRVAQNEQYTISGNGGSGDYSVVGFYYEFPDENSVSYNNGRSVFNANYTFTSPIDGYAVIRSNVPYKDTVQIELGSTATAYEPYTEYTASVDLPEPVYSGTLDLETGEVVADMAMLILNGSESFTYTIYGHENNNAVLRVVTGRTCLNNEKQISNYGVYNANAWQISAIRKNTFVLGGEGNLYVQVDDAVADTVEEFKVLFSSNPLQIVYELATPITYQLTPQQLDLLKGTNVITVNAKTVQVTYREGLLATLEEVNAISFDLSNVKSKLPPIIIKDGMLQVTYDDGQ